ncbi:unnamed protein product [Penicillium nalgiovense]|nr:unnamed protein product [Penicillium nalgiovense]
MTQVAFDDSMVTHEATQNVDYLSLEWKVEDIWDTRKYIRRRKAQLKNYRRLDNALWRVWAKQGKGLPYFPSRLIQWDKDTDITWLFGPWKRCAGLQPFLSYSQLQPGEPASVSFPRTDQGLIQKKFDPNAPRSILLPPRPLSICNPPKKKVCVSHMLLTRPKCRRVRFSREVQQVLCLPRAFPWDFISGHNLSDEQVCSSSLFEIYRSWQTLLPLPPASLKPPEDPSQWSLSLNSPSFCEGQE